MTLLSYLQAHDALWIGGLIAAVIGIYALAMYLSYEKRSPDGDGHVLESRSGHQGIRIRRDLPDGARTASGRVGDGADPKGGVEVSVRQTRDGSEPSASHSLDFDRGFTAPSLRGYVDDQGLPPVVVPFDSERARIAYRRAQAAYRVVSRKVH